jgi:hypothetical protein
MLSLSDALFFLLYFKLSDIYFSNHLKFRAFHCTCLTLLSIKNINYYGTSILDRHSSLQTLYSYSTRPVTNSSSISISTSSYYSDGEYFYLKIIPVYFVLYIFYDFKHCNKRIDLLIHHLVCVLWALTNIQSNLGLISVCIFAEGVTFAYAIPTFKNQLMYRLFFTTIFRFPVWILIAYTYYSSDLTVVDLLSLFNYTIIVVMILMDSMWSIQNYKKLQNIFNDD